MSIEESFNKIPKKEKVDIVEKGIRQLLLNQQVQNDRELFEVAKLYKQRLENFKEQNIAKKKNRLEKELPEMLKWVKNEKDKILKEFETQIAEKEKIDPVFLREQVLKNLIQTIEIRFKAVDIQYKSWLKQFE